MSFTNGDKILEEVKGHVKNREIFELKNRVAEKYCADNGMKFVINYMKKS